MSTGVVRTYYDSNKKILEEEYFEINGKKEGPRFNYF